MNLKNWALPALALVAATPAFANEMPQWQLELHQYQSQLSSFNTGTLMVRHGVYNMGAMATCGSSLLLAGASFIADTMPIANGLSEVVSNTVDEKYQTQTYDSILSWEAMGEMGRGALGGGVIGVAETLELVTLWLAGEEDQSYEAVKKMYASSITTANKLFARQGKCMMLMAKTALTRRELAKRNIFGYRTPATGELNNLPK